MRLRKSLVMIVGFLGIFCGGHMTAHAQIFTDDFETGTLDNWVIGGRQAEGTNIADVVTRHGSLMGHLYKYSFTEINFSRQFDYQPALRFNFDLEVTAWSDPPPADNYYGSSEVRFSFYDSSEALLGFVRYATATTPYIFYIYQSDPTRHAIEIPADLLQHFSLDVNEILSHIDIDETEIATVSMLFNTYSSTRPYPAVTAELWVDNVSVICTDPWETAYNTLFDNQSDLERFRQYRDESLTKTTRGRLYTRLLYNRSEKALQVLLRNPELMMEAKHLIEANKGAVSEVLNGNEGVIYNTDEIVSFLKAYARKSPADLKLLAITVEKEMLRQQRQGEKFLGFRLK